MMTTMDHEVDCTKDMGSLSVSPPVSTEPIESTSLSTTSQVECDKPIKDADAVEEVKGGEEPVVPEIIKEQENETKEVKGGEEPVVPEIIKEQENETKEVKEGGEPVASKAINEQENEEDDAFCWRKFLMANPDHGMEPVPVFNFAGAPLKDKWDQFTVPGLKIEYLVEENLKTAKKTYEKVFWLGTVRKYFGYLAKVEDEGYPESGKQIPYQWLNFVKDCHEIGYCYTSNAVLIPPLQIVKSEMDWRSCIITRARDQLTIHPLVAETFKLEKNIGFKPGTDVEILDKSNMSIMKQGTITDVKGTRVFVRYWDSLELKNTPTSGVWCDFRSLLGAPVPPGWTKTIGHEIIGREGYDPKRISEDFFDEADYRKEIGIGMRLEVICPTNLNYIAAAAVVKVLKFGYMVISIESPTSTTGEEQAGVQQNLYLCHVSSPHIFMCGFTNEVGIELIPPADRPFPDQPFIWKDYFEATRSKPLVIERSSDIPRTGFSIGQKLEAANFSSIQPATVVDIKGPLLRIRIDGSEEGTDQWMHYESFDLYPVGWCDLFEYRLTGPKKDSTFWKQYKHPSQFKARTLSRARTLPRLESSEDAAKKGMKRKAADLYESAVFNSDVMKADAIKLAPKPTVSGKAIAAELRSMLEKEKP